MPECRGIQVCVHSPDGLSVGRTSATGGYGSSGLKRICSLSAGRGRPNRCRRPHNSRARRPAISPRGLVLPPGRWWQSGNRKRAPAARPGGCAPRTPASAKWARPGRRTYPRITGTWKRPAASRFTRKRFSKTTVRLPPSAAEWAPDAADYGDASRRSPDLGEIRLRSDRGRPGKMQMGHR